MNESVQSIELKIARLRSQRNRAQQAEQRHRVAIVDLVDQLMAMRGLLDPSLDPKDIMRAYGTFHILQSGSIYEVLTVVLNDRTYEVFSGCANSCNLRFKNDVIEGYQPGMFYQIAHGKYELEHRAFPKGKVIMEEGRKVHYRDTEVKWLEKMKLCSICRELIWPDKEWFETSTPIDKYWKKGQMPYEAITELDSMAHSGYVTYGIHNCCKPTSEGMKKILSDYSKGYLNERDKDTVELLAKCWPSFAIHAKRPDKQRILRKWAIRNPSRVSTPAARAFFQIHLGIKNLDSALTKAKQITNEYNPNAVAKA